MADAGDHDWLLARERGDDVSHVPAETRARYQELGYMIESLPDRSPSHGWKQRVMAALDEPFARPSAVRSRKRAMAWGIAGAIAALAAAVVLVVLYKRTSHEPPFEPIAMAEIRHGSHPHRSGDVGIGDILVVHVDANRPIELRVYGDTGEFLASCNDDGGCDAVRNGDHRRYTLELVLRARGDVRAVLFTSAAGLSPPHGLDADLAAALRVGIDARQVAVFHVQ